MIGSYAVIVERPKIRAINHDQSAFIENKRCREQQRVLCSVVNPKRGFVYQTHAI
jgi:hypothetical protein